MKKILMLVMMVVTMGLVGCGEMTADEVEKMEKEIVSIAEENGLMYNLGLWILQKVCDDLSRFEKDIDGEISMTVNII